MAWKRAFKNASKVILRHVYFIVAVPMQLDEQQTVGIKLLWEEEEVMSWRHWPSDQWVESWARAGHRLHRSLLPAEWELWLEMDELPFSQMSRIVMEFPNKSPLPNCMASGVSLNLCDSKHFKKALVGNHNSLLPLLWRQPHYFYRIVIHIRLYYSEYHFPWKWPAS